MSGNIFKTQTTDGVTEKLTTPIQQEDVSQTIAAFVDDILIPLGISYAIIGSAGKKKSSGDIDLAVTFPDYPPDRERRKEYNRKISQDISSLLAPQFFSATGKNIVPIKLMGTNIHVRYPIVHSGRKTDSYIQVDLMPSSNPKNTAWLMWGGTEAQVRGQYRALLLNFIAKKRSEELSQQTGRPIKVALATPGGIEIRDPQALANESLSLERTNDPQEILNALQIDAAPRDVIDYESLVDVLKADSRHASSLCEFSDYISHYLTRDAVNAQKAIACIGGSVEESSRNSIASQRKVFSASKLKKFIREVLLEASRDSASSGVGFAKVPWPDELKLFPNLYANKVSASATEGKDEEGAEKAVAASENIIYLAENGYQIGLSGANLIAFKSKNSTIIRSRDEALGYLLGYEPDGELPPAKIAHVPGLEKYDLKIVDGNIPMEVKKMGSPTVLSKLGSSTGRNFENNVDFIVPLRQGTNIAKKYLETNKIIDADGNALVRQIQNAPAAFKISDLSEVVELLNFLFFQIQYSSSKKELKGLASKIASGQLPAGMINVLRDSAIFEVREKNLLEICKKTLDDILGEYSPVTTKSKEEPDVMSQDAVDVSAMLGRGSKKEKSYSGKVSLDYFFSDLIFRLYDNEADETQIDAASLETYTDSIEFLATIYAPLARLDEMQGENIFDEFIKSLVYDGFYGVMPGYYYVIPCNPDKLMLYSTTQGFRALLKIKEVPGSVIRVPKVKLSTTDKEPKGEQEEVPEEEEVDVKVVSQP